MFEVDNVKNAAILRDFLNVSIWQHQKEATLRDILQEWKVESKGDGLVPMRFAIFPFHLFKVLRLPPKSEARSYEGLHPPVTQNHLSKPEDLTLQNTTPSGNQRPDLLTSLMNMSLVSCTAPATRHASLHILLKCPTPANAVETATKPSRFAHFWQGAESLPHPNFQKWSETVSFLHFSCFAPQRRALFRHRNFQKWSEHGAFCAFWLRHVLRATMACTFSTSQLPKVVRTRRFSEPTFRPSGAPKHWKNRVIWDFSTFAHLHLLSSDSFSSLIFLLLLFSSLTLPTSFSSVHIFGSLTFKLPSMIWYIYTYTWYDMYNMVCIIVSDNKQKYSNNTKTNNDKK